MITSTATSRALRWRRARERTRRQRTFVLLAVVLIAAGIAGMAPALLESAAPARARLVDMVGNPVEPDEETASTGSATSVNTGLRFAVRSVGLTTPLLTMNATDGVIDPPGFAAAYVVSNRGVAFDDAADGTIFIAMHSIRGGGVGPGNYLLDVDEQRSAVRTGDAVTVGSRTYRVTGADVIPKEELAARSEIWANTAGRLIVITCLQRGDGSPSRTNLVITAHLT